MVDKRLPNNYSNIAHLLTITTMQVLEQVKQWANIKVQGYSRFLQCQTLLFWMVNSSVEVALNLLSKIHDIFVAFITRCYESIPFEGPDNLPKAVAHIIKLGFAQAKTDYTRAIPLIWMRISDDGQIAHASWETCCPTYRTWFSLNELQLINIHTWLMKSCHITFGDRTWIQQLGIPMGFSCSPLWCNIYLLYYEITFIQWLACLGRADLMNQFKYVFCYIDNLY